MFKRKRPAIGVDIGNRAIKVVALDADPAKGRYRLKGYAVVATPGLTVSLPGTVVADALRRAMSAIGIDERRVRASVSGNTVVVRYIRMPAMALEELRSSIRYEAAQHIPFDVKEVETDCAILNTGDNGDGKMDVVLVAARKSACERVLKILKGAGLSASCLDTDSLATVNAFQTAKVGDGQGPTALLNIGAKQSTVSILRDGAPAFTRCIEVGGEGLSLAIARGLGIELEEAERLKVFGDPLVQPHLEMVLNSIVRQVHSSFDYFEGLAGRSVASLYLSGGTSTLTGMRQFLSDALGVPTREWNPLAGIDTADFSNDETLQSVTPTLDVAVGLATRRVEGA